ETRDGPAAQIITISKSAWQHDGIKAGQRSRFVPNVFRAQPIEPVDRAQAILVTIGTRKLDDGEFHLSVNKSCRSLFFLIIIYHQAVVNHTWNPAEKRQD